jgi:hypothetical protein
MTLDAKTILATAHLFRMRPAGLAPNKAIGAAETVASTLCPKGSTITRQPIHQECFLLPKPECTQVTIINASDYK